MDLSYESVKTGLNEPDFLENLSVKNVKKQIYSIIQQTIEE